MDLYETAKNYAKPASRLLEAPDEAASADREVELLKHDFDFLWRRSKMMSPFLRIFQRSKLRVPWVVRDQLVDAGH